ncbi:MAG TPA: YeeE/YedE thiosulfate transporter family protein [Gemmatimonadaceae bacterium]|nr:YeeE/YedE thiosulfate transporter family protein [Gemmatimonadaceae bacterium]
MSATAAVVAREPAGGSSARDATRVRRTVRRAPAAYASPYAAGVALGLVLLAAYVVMGRGLGASGAFASTAAAAVAAVDPARAQGSALLARYLAEGTPAWLDWLVVELFGVTLGGFLSAALAGRLRLVVERGPRLSPPGRLLLAAAGGAGMGVGAVLARGCTSGQALTGGALLSVGSWLFMGAAFAAAFAAAPLLRRVWT